MSKWLFVLCLPVLLVLGSLLWVVNSHWLYDYGAKKYDMRQTLASAGLNLTESELEQVYDGLIRYYNSNDEYVHIMVAKGGQPFELFNEKEIIHFRDVKVLIWLGYWLIGGTLAYSLVYAGVSFFWRKGRYRRQLARSLAVGGGLTLVLILALGLGEYFGFEELFYRFHLIFFSNEYWSAEGYMLLLFPEGFFYFAALLWAGITAGLAVVLGGVGIGCLRS